MKQTILDSDNRAILDAGQNNQEEEPSISSSESEQSPSKKGSETMRFGSQSKVEHAERQYKTEDLVPVDGGWTNIIWKRGSLRIMTYVVRFVISILINSEKSKFSFMNRKQFTAINDITGVYQFYEENKLIRQRIKKKFKQIIKSYIQNNVCYKIIRNGLETFVHRCLFVIDPSSTIKILWDFFMLFVLSWQMVFVPLKICFFIQIQDPILNFILNYLPVYVYLMEIVLTFLTGYYEHGVLIMDQKQVAKHYFKKSFFYDLLNVLPLLVSAYYVQSNWLEFSVLVKVKTLKFLSDQLEEVFGLRTNYQTLIDVLRLMIQFIFLSHLFGCFWHYLGILQGDYGMTNTWINALELEDDSWQIRYINSIYWSSITTLTIGYGDITPQSSVEKIFTVGVAVFSSVVFAYTISSIGQIFSQLNENKKNQRYKMNLIQQFIGQRGVNKQLQNKVKKFYEYFIQVDHSQDSECELLLNSLEPSLKNELKIDIYKKYIMKSKLFKSTFSLEFLDLLCQLFQERQYTPDEQICAADTEVEELCFVLKGEISLSIQLNNCNQTITFLMQNLKNHILGERFFITGDRLPYAGKAITAVRVAFINKTQFFSLLKQYPQEYEKFLEAKSKVVLKERVKVQGCELCYQNHQVLQCPFVFYYPNVRVIVKRQENITQKRQFKQRSYIKSHKSLLDRGGIQYQLISYALDSNLMREESLDESLIKNMDLQFIEPTKKQFNKIHSDISGDQQQQDQSNPFLNQTPLRPSQEQISEDSDVGTSKTNKTSNNGLQKLITLRQISQQSQNQQGQQKKVEKFKQKSLKAKKSEFKPPEIVELQKIEELQSFESPLGSGQKANQQSMFFHLNENPITRDLEIKRILWEEYVQSQIIEDKERYDQQQDYQFFYPHCNLERILEQINIKVNERKKKTQKSRLTTLGKNRLGQLQNISVRPRKSMITIEQAFSQDDERQKSLKL
ncbi:unnamed protein product (macronuclear) [Paramecium tetraurelia]|uniref:Cyclic nucleotide-binding domain-containing protein n=1 Tax=Paramecium tetraurelia TaxID=5888 RepID=A0DP40_PARTE|nr:uncharacterized protein GSPATT00018988001 [Paramecium tetraurelia]CAK84807.1 unnamed protein product [Paramecium tetraurelia]|eukprot:XP_001452204.1 hypothetical protein (macronuclear) [Paramecium tetraurelia strain d4-2]